MGARGAARERGGGGADGVDTAGDRGASGHGALLGVISDTHGLLRPEALQALEGVERIVHAGDVGDPAILEALAEVAPVTAVRGNVDGGPVLGRLPLSEAVRVGGTLLYVTHILEELDLDPVAAGVNVVVFGHTHRPRTFRRDGVLYLNPGAAGRARFDLPVTLARVEVRAGARPRVVHVDLTARGGPRPHAASPFAE